MSLPVAAEHRARVEAFQRRHRVAVLSLVFTDMVGSTHLKQVLGDREAVPIMQQHHSLVRQLLQEAGDGEEIDRAGDSFFIVFAKPSSAVRFALRLQAGLRALSGNLPRPVQDRVGVHLGEVTIMEQEGTKDLYGIQVDACARVMSLAEGDQILLTRAVFDNARLVLKGQDLPGLGAVSWLNHGAYRLKGVEEPVEICEVGEAGRARLTAPADSEKARRHVTGDAEPVLGWRPAVGQTVPATHWVLERKLGEGGFGEVWLGRHATLKEHRVLKFCFRADRVRSLRREITLFRLLREKVGPHPNIVGVQDVALDAPPFYLVMDYEEGLDLRAWCQARGGAGQVPWETRLEILTQVGEALQAAHRAGVIHRDVKPSNILVLEPADGAGLPVVKLTDFGVGQVVSSEVLAGMTQMGFTQTMLAPGSSTQTGTLMYMAPELLAGRPASPQSDIYALGVLSYQLLTGDLSGPLTMDWRDRFAPEDPLIEDLERCFAGEPGNRFGQAAELAQAFRTLEQRRRQCVEQKRIQSEARRRRQRLNWAAAAMALLLAGAAFYFAFQPRNPPAGSRSGSLKIVTQPPGAEVWVEARRTGATPFVHRVNGAGKLHFELRLAGYDPFSASVPFEAGLDQQFVVVLRQSAGMQLAAVSEARGPAANSAAAAAKPAESVSAAVAAPAASLKPVQTGLDAPAKAGADAEAKAKADADAKAKAETDRLRMIQEQAQRDAAVARAKAEADARVKAEPDARAKAEAEERERRMAEEKSRLEADVRVKADAKMAKAEADWKTKLAANAQAKAGLGAERAFAVAVKAAQAAIEQGKWEDALGQAETALKLKPDDPEAARLKSDALDKKNLEAEAEANRREEAKAGKEPGPLVLLPALGPTNSAAIRGEVVVPPTNETSIVLVELIGQVEFRRAGSSRWQLAATNDVLQPGDWVRTGARSRAKILVKGKQVTTLGERAVFTVAP